MDIKKLQSIVVDALEDVKGQDIVLFDTMHLTSLFDRIAVVSGTSNRQTKSLAASVRDKVKEAGGDIIGMEGEDTGEWVLVDLGDMIVHIMQPAIRQYYRLEEIWGDKPVKLGAAKRKSSAEGVEVAAPKAVSKHLAATQAAPEVKPVRERKATTTAKKAAAAPGTVAAKKPAAKRIPAGTTVRVAVPKAAAADAAAAKAAKAASGPKRATKASAEAPAPAAAATGGAAAPAKKVIRRVKKAED